ncbi:MAG: hypothetical protein MJE12_03785 [Alphaproteobacteria bacterium]|nr:hypothetical protein [Alphaproteobacteria bacterium]
MLRILAFFTALLLIAACESTPAFDPKGKKAMTTPELKAAFVGNTVSGENAQGRSFTKKYFPGGKLTVESKRGKLDGQWKIDKNMVCSKYTNGSGGCRKYYREGDRIFRTKAGSPDGSVSVKKGL